MQLYLHTQISRNVEAYVDDIIIKSRKAKELIRGLSNTSDNLWKYDIKLNPEKRTFNIPSGKLMGYIISARIIKVNAKGESCPQNGSTRELKDAQKLMGCLASLSQFISRLNERGFPLYVLLRKTPNRQWTQEAQQAFNDLKNFLTQPHILVSPLDEQSLLLYIVATTQVVSVVVVLERKEVGHMQFVQWPVYSIMCTPYGCTT